MFEEYDYEMKGNVRTLRAFNMSFLELQLSAWLGAGYEQQGEIYDEVDGAFTIHKVKVIKR